MSSPPRPPRLPHSFQFEPLRDGWELRYAQLCELRLQHPDDLLALPLPQQLASWVTFQRQQWRRGRLAPERWALQRHSGGLHCSCCGASQPSQQRAALPVCRPL